MRAPGTSPDVLSLGGDDDDPAISDGGRTISYGQLRDSVARLTPDPVTDISSMTVPDAAVHLFAAARCGTVVVVHDPAMPALAPSAPMSTGRRTGDAQRAASRTDWPAGTWLVATTSGSTGTPRAIARTAASWAASVAPLAELAGLSAADRVFVAGPLYSTLSLHGLVHTLAIGAHLLDAPREATAMHGVPTALRALAESLPAGSPMRTVVVAGATLPDSVAAAAAGRGWRVLEYYGAAELSFVAARRLPATALVPFPGVAVRRGTDGVLWVRSPYLASGYVTARAASDLRRSSDGFVTVGDVIAGETGDLSAGFTVRGRGGEAVNTGGFTVLVGDVEAALNSLPGVRTAAVFGAPHPRLGQIVVAALELAPGADLGTIRAAARELLPAAARPRRYRVVAALPVTSSGKIARDRLPELLEPIGVGAPDTVSA